MLVLGIETSCDETGVAVYDSGRGLLAHALHSQVALHDAYGGVVPELASRDHIRRLLPLVREVLRKAGAREADLDAVAYTQGPGLAGALLVGAAVANSFAFGLGIRAIGVHHLDEQTRADVAAAFQEAVADVLVAKSLAAMRTTGLDRLVVAGGVGANVRLRSVLDAAASRGKFSVFYPALEFCTDNGAMIALAGYLRLKADEAARALPLGFTVRPRWDLASVAPPETPG